MNTISISEIQRNLHKLDEFDIIEVVDKKRHQVKGYFLDKKYHDEVMVLLKAKDMEEKNYKKARGILQKGKTDPSIWQEQFREENERDIDKDLEL